jgi:hypothetical protein
LNSLSGSAASSAVTNLLQQGLNQIGSLGSSIGATPGSATTNSPAGGATATPPTSSSTTTTTTTPPTTTPTTSCGLLAVLLGCPASKGSSSTSSGGLGGLLSQDVSPTKKQQGQVNLASTVNAGPSLTAPAARLLPPLPSSHHAPAVHRGLLSQWAHDLGGWL